MAANAEVTIAMLNGIRNGASTDFQNRFPYISADSDFYDWKAGFTSYTPFINEFTDILINKIGLTLFADKLFKNKLAMFKKGEIITGSDVEEIFVEMISGVAYDPEGLNPLARKKPDNVHVMYHRQNFQRAYEISVSDQQVKTAFRSLQGVAEFVSSLINAMYSGANFDEYVAMKKLMGEYANLETSPGSGVFENGYTAYDVTPITDQATATAFVKTIHKAAQDCSFVTTTLNYAKVKTWCESGECALLLNKDVAVDINIDVLAQAFNRSDVALKIQPILLDDFGSLADTYGLLVDKDWFRIFDTLHNVESMRNPKGMFTNYFLNVWQIFSLSKFKNAIQFKVITA